DLIISQVSTTPVASVEIAHLAAVPLLPLPLTPYDPSIYKYALTYGVDPNLVRAVMITESSNNPAAISRKRACGLMQLMPATAKRFGVKDRFDPDQNIEGAVKYLRFLLNTFDNDVKLTLAAYNAGEHAVKRAGGIPRYRETIHYVEKITAIYGNSYRPFASLSEASSSLNQNSIATD
ncbi:MAG TPA: lytic transglycosylase domain-containing protein, partial [Acidobacteriota bacterium]|nr:lytic transglycosylase domain-containing protein [Acidobacteriota bacterium]